MAGKIKQFLGRFLIGKIKQLQTIFRPTFGFAKQFFRADFQKSIVSHFLPFITRAAVRAYTNIGLNCHFGGHIAGNGVFEFETFFCLNEKRFIETSTGGTYEYRVKFPNVSKFFQIYWVI